MVVVNKNKNIAKINIKQDLKNEVTLINDLINKINSITSNIDCEMSGSLLETDVKLINYCRECEEHLKKTLSRISSAQSFVEQLNVEEEVKDNEYF